jgi:hypothetical protein
MVGGKPLVLSDGKSAGGSAPPAPAAAAAPSKPGQGPKGPPAIDALEIKGLYLDSPPNEKQARIIDEFVDNLKSSPVFAIGEDKTKVVTQRTTPTGEVWAYGYTLVIPLKNPIPIP